MAVFLLFLVFLLDMVGAAIVYVIFPPLILRSGMLDPGLSQTTHNLLIGIALAAYPLAQLFFAPIFGELADRYGRRPVLLATLTGTAVAFVVTGVGIVITSFALLVTSRFLAGIAAANTTVAQAGVADRVSERRRSRAMALFPALSGLGWILGPFFGSLLAEIDDSAPFWIVAILFALLIPICWWKIKRTVVARKDKLEIFQLFCDIASVFRKTKVGPPFAVEAVTLIGWLMFQGFLATYLIERYSFTTLIEGDAYAVAAIAWFLGGLSASGWLLRRHKARTVPLPALFVAGLCVLCFILFPHRAFIWAFLTLGAYSQGLATACFVALFSELVPTQMLGRIYGAWNGSLAFAMVIGPILSGALSGLWLDLPYLLAAIVLLAAATAYTAWWRRTSHS